MFVGLRDENIDNSVLIIYLYMGKKKKKNYEELPKGCQNAAFFFVFILIAPLLIIEFFSERGANCWMEETFGIETDCDGYLYKEITYKDYNQCRLNEDCWDKVFNSLINTAVNDISDGVVDGEYYYSRKRITDAINDIVDDNLEYKLISLFQKKVEAIDPKYQQKVLDEFGLELN
tara:strand:+ start:202 stop:726 length:525 start_codon:yes stop_codon:yes gene_type:complete